MENEVLELEQNSKEKISCIFSDFMTRIAKFEELVSAGSRLVVGFQEGIEYLRRPPIDRNSKLVNSIIKANETKRLLSYMEAGCLNTRDSVLSVSKLNTCHTGLQDLILKAKCIMDELQCILDEAASVVQSSCEDSSQISHEDFDVEEKLQNPEHLKLEVTDYAAMMAVLYSMVKQDYLMQECVVSALSLKSAAEELESYCLMWSLRPFIDDEIMQMAWGVIK